MHMILFDPNGAGMASVGTMTVTAPSDGVVRVETERATHVMDAVLAEWVFTVYKKDGDDYVFTGPYAVDAFVGGGHIDLGGRLGLGRLGRRSRPEGARRGGDGRPRGPRVLDATRPHAL